MFVKTKMFCNDKRNDRLRCAVGFVHVFSENVVSMMKLGAFVMYPVHPVLLKFSLNSGRNLFTMDIKL